MSEQPEIQLVVPAVIKCRGTMGLGGPVFELEIERDTGVIWCKGRQVGQAEPAQVRAMTANAIKGVSMALPYCDHHTARCTNCQDRP